MPIKSGQKTFNCVLKTKADNAEDAETVIASHATFMKENHSLDSTKIRLKNYYSFRAMELKDISNLAEATTDNVVYTINEVYPHEDGIGQHMDSAMELEGIRTFLELLAAHGEVLIANGEAVHHI